MYARIENGLIVETMGLPPYPWTDVPQAEQEYAGWFRVDTSERDAVDTTQYVFVSLEVVMGESGPKLAFTLAAKPVEVPQTVSRFQALAALHLAGLLPTVEQIMASGAVDPLAKLAWENATEFRRSSPTVAALAAMLTLDDAALDQLFVTAAGIEA